MHITFSLVVCDWVLLATAAVANSCPCDCVAGTGMEASLGGSISSSDTFPSRRVRHVFCDESVAAAVTKDDERMTTSSTSNEAPPSHVVNFGCGHPDASLLPMQQVAEATHRALITDSQGGSEWLQYARENGNPRARTALADFLTHLYYSNENSGSIVDPDTLCVTSGVSHGIQLTCRTLHRMHTTANSNLQQDHEKPLCLVEDPTYFLVPAIVQQSGYDLQSVATTARHGLDVTALRRTLQQVREASPHRLMVLYTIPVHHNPLGVSLSEDDRQRLVAMCEDYDVYLIADEVYQGLGFVPAPTSSATPATPAPMALRSSRVISVSAFTKILCPGIRCGWIQTLNLELLREIGKDAVLDSGGCSSQLSSGIATQMMSGSHINDSPLVSYMTSLQTEYAKRCHHLCHLLQEASNDEDFGFEFETPQGGYFLWVQLTGIDFSVDEAFRTFCRSEYHVDFKTGASCSSATRKTPREQSSTAKDDDERFSQCVRLCFAYYNIPSLTQGMERLCRAIRAYSQNPQRTRSSL